MRKLLIITLLLSLSIFNLTACTDEDSEKDKNATTEKNSISSDINEISSISESTAIEGEGGGNENKNNEETEKIKTISITVSENKYFYDNKSIEFEYILDMLKESDKNTIIEVTENNATHKAYDKLIEKIKELELSLIEK